MWKRVLVGLLSASFVLLLCGGAFAAWPADEPINFIVAYSPGGSSDVVARLIATTMEEKLGQKIIVLNKPGAGGEIGFTALSNADPDGYTIGMLNIVTLLTIPIERKAQYSLDTLTPVADIMEDPVVLCVKADDDFKNVGDVISRVKAGHKVTYGTGAIGSDKHLGMQQFAKLAGIDLKHIPFSGSAPSRTALLGGHIKLCALSLSEAKEFADTGQIRIIGQMTESRTALLPDVPTFKEQGYDVTMASRRGIGVPQKTPAAIVNRLSDLCKQVVDAPQFQKKAENAFLTLNYMPSDEYKANLVKLDTELNDLWETDPWREKK